MLPEPLAGLAHLQSVAIPPEAPQEVGPIDARRPVESGQVGIRRDHREVRPEPGHGGRVLERRRLVIRRLRVAVSRRETGAGQLQQADRPAPARREVALEGGGRRVQVSGSSLEPATREQDAGGRARGRGSAAQRGDGRRQERGVPKL